MRIAVVLDIHGNLSALEAVLADLRSASPDLILHGGDLADSGSSPVEIVDRIRDLGWPGVAGNTDQLLFAPETLDAFSSGQPTLDSLWNAIREMAAFTRNELGEERLAWLRSLTNRQSMYSFLLVHAKPGDPWRAPTAEASDDELNDAYTTVCEPLVVYGHIHRPFIRRLDEPGNAGRVVVNSGSVGMPYDGDTRASYLLLDGHVPTIRRVEYDLGRELNTLTRSRLPHAGWVAGMLRSASPQMP